METLEAVIEGALNYNTPIVCAVYEPQFKYTDLEPFTTLLKDIAGIDERFMEKKMKDLWKKSG